MFRCCLGMLGLLVATLAQAQDGAIDIVEAPTFSPEQIEFFETQVRPVLVRHCYDCHSSDAAELKAGLYVDSREAMQKGGDSGPAVLPGKPKESLLIAAVKYQGIEMPLIVSLKHAKSMPWKNGLKWARLGHKSNHLREIQLPNQKGTGRRLIGTPQRKATGLGNRLCRQRYRLLMLQTLT